jgi:hypothetical protein
MPDIMNVPADGTGVPSQAGRTSGHSNWRVVVYYVALCLFGLYFFNRHSIWTGGDLVYGDRGDSRFHMVTLEHWWRVLTGHDALLSPNFFYPVPGVIAYSDLLALYGLFYIPLRAFGVDTYTSFQLTIAGVCAVAFWSMLLFAQALAEYSPGTGGTVQFVVCVLGIEDHDVRRDAHVVGGVCSVSDVLCHRVFPARK